jgi:hypothetical protein
MTEYEALDYIKIEEAMRLAINKQDEFTKAFAAAADEYASAEATFKVAFAQARLTARAAGDHEGRKVTESYADDLATVGTQEERFAMESCKARYDSTRQALLSVRSRLEALRSLMASHREVSS